jgi:hypothetical protein
LKRWTNILKSKSIVVDGFFLSTLWQKKGEKIMKKIVTSESVNIGHPDKTCDVIADAFLDAALSQDPNAQMAVECAIKNNKLFVYGEATTTANVDYVTECQDAMMLPSNCHFLDGRFYDRYEKAKSCGVFYFWGHSYELMEYDKLWEQYEMKIKYITEDPDSEWVNVVDIAPLCDKGFVS